MEKYNFSPQFNRKNTIACHLSIDSTNLALNSNSTRTIMITDIFVFCLMYCLVYLANNSISTSQKRQKLVLVEMSGKVPNISFYKFQSSGRIP